MISMTSRKDLFRQSQCAVCHGFFYDDEMKHNDEGLLLCRHCFINTFAPKKGLSSRLNIELPMGVNLLEMIAVIAIIGVLVGIIAPNVMKMHTEAEQRNLMTLYYSQQNSEVGEVAEQVMTAYEEGQSLEEIAADLPQLSDISDEEFQQLETELSGLVGMDTDELKLAKAIRALMDLQWDQDELEQFD